MSDIQISITGDKELVERLKRLGGGQLNLNDSLDDSGRYLTRFFGGEVFASRGRVIDESWASLNPSYAAWKARTFPGRPPLVRTGEMMRSFGYTASPLRLELFNTADHFLFHQEGTGRAPKRVMMKVDQRRAVRVGEFIETDLNKQILRAGLL